MANLRKRQIKGTILLEALLALGVFAVIASLLLGQITQSRKEAAVILQKEEVLRVAQMALQTGQDHLSLNGIETAQPRIPSARMPLTALSISVVVKAL